MEMVWRGSRSFEQLAEVFAGIFATDNVYGPPDGFCFDMRACNGGTPVQADRTLNDYNLDAYVQLFEQRAREQARVIQGNQLMWLLGSDFQASPRYTTYCTSPSHHTAHVDSFACCPDAAACPPLSELSGRMQWSGTATSTSSSTPSTPPAT